MDVRTVIQSQYHSCLAMLKAGIEACSDELWTDTSEGVPYWQLVCHTLFFTHFYSQPAVDGFKPWHPWPNGFVDLDNLPPREQWETKERMLAFQQFCEDEIDGWVDRLDLDAEQCGFPWYPMGKLEHQFVNLRHIMHHVGALSDRLKRATGAGIAWVG